MRSGASAHSGAHHQQASNAVAHPLSSGEIRGWVLRAIRAAELGESFRTPTSRRMPHWDMWSARGLPLFGADLPNGFRYRRDFTTPDEEAALAAEIARVEFSTFEMRGVVAPRRGARTPPPAAAVSPGAARKDRLVGGYGGAGLRDGAHQRVRHGRADWLAPRRTTVRHRRRHFAAVVLSDDVPAVPAATGPSLDPAWPATRHSRSHAGTAIRVPDERGVEDRV